MMALSNSLSLELTELRLARISAEPEYFELTAVDELSHLVLFKIRFPLEQFPNFLTSRTVTKAVADFSVDPRIGKVREIENVIVLIPKTLRYTDLSEPKLDLCLAVWETDGWKVRRSDLGNGHNSRGQKDGVQAIEVLRERWVDHVDS